MQPQIIKRYASGQDAGLLFFIFFSVKCTFFLMYICAFPMILEMPIVLSLWLKNLPEYAIIFTRLVLVDAFIISIMTPLGTLIIATGKIKLYQFVCGVILVLNSPLSWIALVLNAPPYSVMVISIYLSSINSIAHLFIIRRLFAFPIRQFLSMVILPIGIVSVLSAILPIIIHKILVQGFLRLCIVLGASVISLCACMYLFGLNNRERSYIKNIIRDKVKRLHK
jgi:hypothetical protein